MKSWLFSYWFEGSQYSITIMADTADEAKRRISAMQRAILDGEVMAIIPAKLGFVARFIVSLRNMARQ